MYKLAYKVSSFLTNLFIFPESRLQPCNRGTISYKSSHLCDPPSSVAALMIGSVTLSFQELFDGNSFVSVSSDTNGTEEGEGCAPWTVISPFAISVFLTNTDRSLYKTFLRGFLFIYLQNHTSLVGQTPKNNNNNNTQMRYWGTINTLNAKYKKIHKINFLVIDNQLTFTPRGPG